MRFWERLAETFAMVKFLGFKGVHFVLKSGWHFNDKDTV
jgi:hypothetical protein